MGFFSKLLDDDEPHTPRPKEEIREISELVGCEWQYINKPLNSEEVFELYKEEYARGEKNGYTPVILVPNGHLLEMIESNYEYYGGAENYREKVLKADLSNGEAILRERFEANIEMYDGALDDKEIYGEYPDTIRPMSCFYSNEKAEHLMLVRIPVTEPWKVFAWIPFGGWNLCPDTEDLIAVCKYWYNKYSAVPAVISSDELQMYVPEPINSREEALKAAEEHYAFCNDTVDQGTGTIKALAGYVLNSSVWYFWWD